MNFKIGETVRLTKDIPLHGVYMDAKCTVQAIDAKGKLRVTLFGLDDSEKNSFVVLPEDVTPVPVTIIKDSGDRTVYSTGAQRDRRVGKGMPCLIPIEAMERVSKHYEAGRNKYSTENGDNLSEENWKKGFPLCDMADSAVRHITKWRKGLYDEDHLAAVVWNILGIMELERRIQKGILPKKLDNRDINEFENPRDLYGELEG